MTPEGAVAVIIVAVLFLFLWVRCAWLERELARLNPNARNLGRSCIVTEGGHSYLATCVCVSLHGGVAVRGKTLQTSRTVWIGKRFVKDRVKWVD